MTERLYYADSFLTDFDAVVTEIQELSRNGGKSLWRVALDRSAFYPTSGGQPHDTGHLLATARSGAELAAAIVGVEEDEAGQVWHHTEKPLSAGTHVHGAVDAARRIDHIQQHSGQHVLSAAFARVGQASTVSFHLGETISTIDLAVDGLVGSTLREVEELANQVIAEDRPVTVTTVSRQQAQDWLAAGELRKLPPREGDLRIIDIADFDRNACGGTHVRSTGQIGGLHLRGTEKVRQGVRVEFVCGLRAMRAVREDFRLLGEAGRLLAVGFAEIPEAIEHMQSRAKQAAKQALAQAEDLIAHRAAKLVREVPVENGCRIVWMKLSPEEYSSAAQAKLLASKLVAAEERAVAIFAWQSTEGGGATVIFARSAGLPFDCGTLLREVLTSRGGRGGGSKDMAQGSIVPEHLHDVMDELRTAVERNCSHS